MKSLWILARTILFALLMMSTTLLFVGTTVVSEHGASERGETSILVLQVVSVVLGILLVLLETKYSKKFKFIGTYKIIINELVLLSIVVYLIHYNFKEIEAFTEQYLYLGTPTIFGLTILLFIVIALLPSAVLRRKYFPKKVKATKVLSPDEWIHDINHRYDTKTGSINFQTEYKNKRRWLKKTSWRGVGRDIHAHLDFELSRPLSSMSHKEREACRILELLEADGLNRRASDNLRAPLVWANGKGTIGNYHASYVSRRSSDAWIPLADSVNVAVEWFMKNVVWYPNFDSAVAKVLDIVNELYELEPKSPFNIEIKRRLEGGNAWLNSEQFNDSGFVSNQPQQGGIFLGDMPDGSECWFTGQGAIITIAPPGSGKTQTHIIPNLLKWRGPAVVLDVKGELWDKTAGYRAKHVGPVYRFAPLNPDHSHCFNPLTLVRSDTDYLWGDAKFLASMIATSSNTKDPFWESKARELITAAIAVECMTHSPEERDMATVVGYCYGRNWVELIARLEASSVSAMKNAATSLLKSTHDKNQTLGGIQMQAQSYMSAWEGARVERATKTSHWHPNDLRDGNITIYIGLKAGEIDAYSGLLRIFIAQHIKTLVQELPHESAPDILFMLDEFPRLKFMSEIEEALEIGRQFKIKLFLAVQSIGQVKQHYKNADGLIGACAIRAFMNPSSQDGTTEKITKELGHIESIVDGSRKNIAEETDLTGAEYANDVIILTTGTKPIRAKKSFAYQDSEWVEQMDMQPPDISPSKSIANVVNE